ncbi:MAG: cytoplasmic protein [Deltaproteobacteria bacterium]|nr:cytoplasmic protein [Deltaproteobacteria bacterium]
MNRYGNGNPLSPFIGQRRNPPQRPREDQFQNLNATSLYCPKCKAAMPVVERLLLILPDGELYEYKCRRCGTSLGERKVTKKPEPFLVR